MKLFALRDEASPSRDLAYLECYEAPRAFYFELPPGADPWELPFILHEFAQRSALTVDAAWSRRWVESRIVPPERQNLGEVLRENGLAEYDELHLLELTGGRCAQDSFFLAPVARSNLPAWYAGRLQGRMRDVAALSGFRLLCTTAGGEALLCCMQKALSGRRAFARVMADESVFARAGLQPGGHGVRWGEALLVSAEELHEIGVEIPLSAEDLASTAGQMLVDTSEAAQLLGCTRQNVADLVRRGRLAPVRTGLKGMLFLRADVLARKE